MKKILFVVMMALPLLAFDAFAERDPITDVLKKYNCTSCHAIDTKIFGPAFRDVANKYKNVPSAENALVKKVSVGGKGVWGSDTMPAVDAKSEHQDDIRRAVQFVLRQSD